MQMHNEVKKEAGKFKVMERSSLIRMSTAKMKDSCASAVGFYYGTTVDEQILSFKNGCIAIFPVMFQPKDGSEKRASKYVIAFDMQKIKHGALIELKVPKGKAGLFAGHKKWQVKKLCQQLNLKFISIIEEA